MNPNISRYNNSGRTSELVNISANTVVVNLQTLVGNGFITGSTNGMYNEEGCNNGNASINCNKKVILEPYDNLDIGSCEIRITKFKTGSRVCYKVEKESGSEICPTTVDFGGDSQC